ncbi:hypothetical protein BDV93DRAFT_583050 [Ceratobasidium sp. AG-I]|nr:hypothetical protein BDV93DRAFT_583050 [Ceratobasidium sp. AG-I]
MPCYSHAPGSTSGLKPLQLYDTTDFYATLMFGAFMTVSGVFGLVAESLNTAGSRWWFCGAYAMQALGVLVGKSRLERLARLLTPDYLFGLLSIAAPPNGVPSWRIYALILVAIIASITSLVSTFIAADNPVLASSVPTFLSLCLPLPLLFSLARIVNSARVDALSDPPATTAYSKRTSKCTELGLLSSEVSGSSTVTLRFPRIWEIAFTFQCIAAIASACEIVQGVMGNRLPALKLLAAMGYVAWGGGIMTIHFVIIYEPSCRSPIGPPATNPVLHDIERVIDQPSEDFMTLRDPFASPTQTGLPLPPSPTATRRKPRRRASEPLQLARFGSFAGLRAEIDEKQPEPEDPEARFLEALVRHALFSTGREDSDSRHVNSHADATPTGSDSSVAISDTNALGLGDVVEQKLEEQSISPRDVSASGHSTPTIRQKRGKELQSSGKSSSNIAPVPVSRLLWHPFRPMTPPRPARAISHLSQRPLPFPLPPSSFPLPSPSSGTSACSLSSAWSTAPSAYKAPPSPSSSDSGSSFVSPPPTPTPGSPGMYPVQKVLYLNSLLIGDRILDDVSRGLCVNLRSGTFYA